MRHWFLEKCGRLSTHYALVVALAALVVTVLAVGEAKKLHLKTGQMDLTPKDNEVRNNFQNFLQDFQVLDDIFILVTYHKEADAKKFAKELDSLLIGEEEVKEVFVRLDLETLLDKFLYLIETDKLDSLLASLKENGSLLQELSKEQELKTLLTIIKNRMSPKGGPPPDLDKVEQDLTLVLEVLRTMTRSIGSPDKKEESLWRRIFFPKDEEERLYDEDGYILSKKAKKLLLIVKSSRYLTQQDEVIRYFTKVHGVVEKTLEKYEGLSVGYAGSPAITYDEKATVEGDMFFSTLLSLTGITLLFIISLQSFIHPLLGVSTLLVSLICTFGITQLVIGHLTLVSTAFTATLIGIGIGFGIHIVACYEEERARGSLNDEAIMATLHATGPGVITGATTSAAAFYTMLLTEFTAFQELGFIAGTGLLIAMWNMLVLLPALLTLKARLFPKHTGAVGGFLSDAIPSEEARPWLAEIGRFCRDNSMTIGAVFAFAILAGVPMALTIGFDYNLLNLQASSSAAVLNEHELVEDFNISPEFNAVIVPTVKKAHKVTKKLRDLASVARVESISDLIPNDLKARQRKIDPLRKVIASLSDERKEAADPDPEELMKLLKSIGNAVKALRVYAFFKGKHSLVIKSSELETEVSNWRLAFDSLPYEVGIDRMRRFQKKLFDDLNGDISMLKKAFKAEPYSVKTLPKALRERYLGQSGNFVVYVFPSIDVRKEVYAKRFINDTASLKEKFTGLPVIKDEMVNLIRRGFFRASLYALIALAFMVYLDFRRLFHSLTVLIALIGGTVFMLSGMCAMGVKFNPANFVALPIILGIGVDNGVHIMQRYLGGASLREVLLRTGRAITLNSLTTMIGFGSLALSSYQGFATLGLIMVAGVASCYLTAVVLQPALMYVLLVSPLPVMRQAALVIEELLAFNPDI